MSKYIRDDKTFRAQISNLADAGLKFPTAPAKLPEYPLHFDEMETKLVGFSKNDYPANFNGVPAYVRTIEPPEIGPKGKLPEFVAGLVTGMVLLAGLTFLVKVILMVGGVR